MEKIIAHAPAKINLVLEVAPLVAGQEKHCLDSIFCTTSLSDTLVFDFVEGREPFNAQVAIQNDGFETAFIKENDNTLIKSVEHFKREFGFGFLPTGTLKVELIKSIPTQAGLGGGSSDAAAMLRMLCWLVKVEPLSERALLVARAVGADVPFFLYAGKEGLCAHMAGFGDTLVEAVPKPQMHIALVKPARGVSTKRAFAAFDSLCTKAQETGATKRLAQALKEEKGLRELAALCANNLEPVAAELLPDIATLKEELKSFPGVLGATLSGSGSALFALCESAEASHACMQYFASEGYWAVAALT